jgi:acetyl-CoA carboxylase carboxyl transferase subunit beta
MSAVTMSDADQSGEVPRKKRGVPEGLWISCEDCKNTVFRKQVEKNLFLCPDCNYHFTVPGRIRIQQLLDEDSFEEWFTNLKPKDPLSFVDTKPYKDRLIAEQKKSGLTEACIAGRGYMRGRPLVFALTDSSFIMGSMGSVVGEKLTRSVEEATRLNLPLVDQAVGLACTRGSCH